VLVGTGSATRNTLESPDRAQGGGGGGVSLLLPPCPAPHPQAQQVPKSMRGVADFFYEFGPMHFLHEIQKNSQS
jgi:hypothetical protein